MLAAAGLIELTEGRISVNGTDVIAGSVHADLGFLAQDKPMYRQFTVRDMLDVGRHLNLRWDTALAARLCHEARLDRRAKVRTLSGGERARLALALVLARHVTMHDSIEVTLDRHLLLTGPGGDEGGLASLSAGAAVVEIRRSLRQLTVLLDGRPSAIPEGWTATAPTVEEIVVARFRSGADVGEAAA